MYVHQTKNFRWSNSRCVCVLNVFFSISVSPKRVLHHRKEVEKVIRNALFSCRKSCLGHSSEQKLRDFRPPYLTKNPCGKQHFREIATPDWVSQFTNPTCWRVLWHLRKVLTQSGVAISRKCCFPHGEEHHHTWVLEFGEAITISFESFRFGNMK
jgi:hypothetical protein